MNSPKDQRRSNHRNGFSLIEIVVGLVLMGTVLVGSLQALTRHRRQLVLAQERIVAARVADEVLLRLSSQRDGVPINARGAVARQPNWFWQTRVVGLAEPLSVPVRVIRLEIVNAERLNRSTLVSVEIVKPVSLVEASVVQASVVQASARTPSETSR